MRDPFAGYDAWLERPYQDMMEESDRFSDWAESEGYDLDDTDVTKKAEEAYLVYLEEINEAMADAAMDARLDWEYERMEEREWAGVEDAW